MSTTIPVLSRRRGIRGENSWNGTRLLRLLGSLVMAVPLLVIIAGVLAWGTIYETRFGTAAVQRYVYHSWWFEGLLGFLAVNLAASALSRCPWKRRHLPFLLAHLGIILILLGGIIGGQFGIEGQLIIPEGQAERMLQLPGNVLVVHEPNPGVHHVIPTNFETTAWNHEPHALFDVPLHDRPIRLVVDRYYPDAEAEDVITNEGEEENPAIHLLVSHEEQQEGIWLLAKDPERFGTRWGEAHLLFLEATTEPQIAQLLGISHAADQARGVVSVKVPGSERWYEVPVPERLGQSVTLPGSAYSLTFRDYFPDFAITEQGLTSRSEAPNNPAVSLTLSGPEGVDAHLLFALHPDFPALHGRRQRIAAQVRYTRAAGVAVPPNALVVIRHPTGALSCVLTDAQATPHLEPCGVGTRGTHPWLGYQFEIAAVYPRAKITPRFTNRGNEVRDEALHLMAQDGGAVAEAWLGLRGSAELRLGARSLIAEYRPDQRELPVTVKLLDFRKTEYPGTQMASGFESDVQLSDPRRGIILMRTISMNNPLRYRGFSFYQSSYLDGPTQTTILSVRSDPGTPFVYAGFLIVIAGVVSLFVLQPKTAASPSP